MSATAPDVNYHRQQNTPRERSEELRRELSEHERRYFFSADDVEARLSEKYARLQKEIQRLLEQR